MACLENLEQSVGALLEIRPYVMDPNERRERLLELLKSELAYARGSNQRVCNYLRHWPTNFLSAKEIADLPYLPVTALKANPPLSLVAASEIRRTITSSATSAQQPSRVVLDAVASRRMAKGVVAILRDFIGPRRRPYLVIDIPENIRSRAELGARSAAIQSLMPFATEIVCCLRRDPQGEFGLDLARLLSSAMKWGEMEVLVYGFTYVIWTQLVQPLEQKGITLAMPNIHVLHSGGWKRLEGVSKDAFNRGVASVFGCSTDRVIDYYGLVENVGVIYPDCECGYKHVPAFAEVIVRDPLTLAPAPAGQAGMLQVCSVLPTSFPGFLLLTEDLAELVGEDGCRCGRRGTYFRYLRRVPKAEMRGCGNVASSRKGYEQAAVMHA